MTPYTPNDDDAEQMEAIRMWYTLHPNAVRAHRRWVARFLALLFVTLFLLGTVYAVWIWAGVTR
jgi:hypothetical protein